MARITQADLEGLRMPPDALGNPGLQDIEALKAASWGTDYDVDARRRAIEEARNRITAALVAQQVPVQLAQQIADQQITQTSSGDGSIGLSGQTSSGATDFSSPGNTGPGGGAQGFGGSAAPGSDFMGGAPPGASMFGTGDRSSVTDPFGGGAMTTSQAAMVGEPAPDGAQPASVFGREGDDSSAQSQGAREAQAQDFAMSAFGRESEHDRSMTAPGWATGDPIDVADIAEHAPAQAPDLAENAPGGKGDKEGGDEDALAEGATSTVGDRAALGLPSGSPGLPSMVGWDTGRNISDLFDAGKSFAGRGWDAVTAPVMTPGDVPVAAPDRAPVATNTPQPGGRTAFAAPGVPGTPGVADPGGAVAPGGFGGFSEPSPGGFTSGFGSTEGFGAGFSGSASMGNTQGGQGFTAGAPGGGFTSGAGSFTAGFQAGFDTATAAIADPSGGAVGFGGADGGDTSGSSSGDTSSGGDTAGGSAGSGVG